MNKIFILSMLVLFFSGCQQTPEKEDSNIEKSGDASEQQATLSTPFEKSEGKQTATYQETIDIYQTLAQRSEDIFIEEYGKTDSGLPLHLVTYHTDGLNWETGYSDKVKVLINNGIHPGESDGIDATLMLFRDLAEGKVSIPDNIVLSTIPVYNVGGALNRNSGSRTNQNGPESYGFRGNGRNYDLNRDFIKADTHNARTFYQIYHTIVPDVFIDNHVSNGADYQYTVTHLFTQPDKLDPAIGNFMRKEMIPAVVDTLRKNETLTIPYVNVWGDSPDKGYAQFFDHPRYSIGYTALWNTLGMMVETHMLKPYADRVTGTRHFMDEIISFSARNASKIKELRKKAFKNASESPYYTIGYQIDESRADTIAFKGYEPVRKKSTVTGQEILTYDRSMPTEYTIPYRSYFKPIDSVKVPEYYVVPQAWWQVVERLRLNNVEMQPLAEEKVLNVGTYYIKEYKTTPTAYEGHYPHSNIEVSEQMHDVRFRESDLLIPTDQPAFKYIMEVLEPGAADSFFKWNFFDTILQQKEHFSPYVFEQTAQKMLKDDAELKQAFDSLKKSDPEFANSNSRQLDWLHKRSGHYEKEHLRYPIYKLYSNE